MAILLISENGHKIQDFISPIREIPEFSTLEINAYTEDDALKGAAGLILEYDDDFREISKSYPVLIAYDPRSIDLFKLEEFLKENPEIHGSLDLEKSLNLQIPLIRDFLKTTKNTFDLNKLEQKVFKLRKESKSHLAIIKKTFEKMVPVRTIKNKGINIHVKFASGMSQGGEFFDFLNISLETLILWNKSNTYQGSNNFLDHFHAFKEDSSDLEGFIKDLNPEKDQEIFLGQINLKNLSFSGFNLSNCFCYFKGDREIPRSSFENLKSFNIQLERGERFYILSSGVIDNLAQLNPDLDLKMKLDELSLLSPSEVLNEIFFELKRNCHAKFLPHDSAIIIVEVDKNVIFQV